MVLSPPPLSLYIHTPWCVRKCPYCDFNSHERSAVNEEAYRQALVADLEADLPLLDGRDIATVFIGGGTPSLLSGDFYSALFRDLRARLPFSDTVEITLEANPGTTDMARFEGFRAAGINRLSLGVQSFSDSHLQALGRIHSGNDAENAVSQARAAGFTNINLDIMHALPGQTQAQALADLHAAVALSPAHISWYELTIEPNTVFYRAPPTQPDSDSMADTEQAGFALLAQAGYQRYEISAFARDGQRCEHNLNYWQYGDYLGIGAGAHSKLTMDNAVHRFQKTRKPEDYLKTPGKVRRQMHTVGAEDGWFEAMLNGLRLVKGIHADGLENRTGLVRSCWPQQWVELQQKNLLNFTNDHIACTEKGLAHLNGVLEYLAKE